MKNCAGLWIVTLAAAALTGRAGDVVSKLPPPAAHYAFEGNAQEATRRSLDGVEHTVRYDAGVCGQGLRLDGNGYVSIAPGDDLVSPVQGGCMTLAVWARLEAMNKKGANAIAGQYRAEAPAESNFYVGIGTTGCRLTGTGTDSLDGGQAPLNEWVHLVFVFAADTNQVGTIYCNGQAVTNGTITLAPQRGLLPLTVGGVLNANRRRPAPELSFTGVLDELVIWDCALTGEQVAELYKSYREANGGAVRFPAPEESALDKRVKELMTALAGAGPEQRMKMEREIIGLGPRVRGAVRAFLENDDPELRFRAKRILEKIGAPVVEPAADGEAQAEEMMNQAVMPLMRLQNLQGRPRR